MRYILGSDPKKEYISTASTLGEFAEVNTTIVQDLTDELDQNIHQVPLLEE